MAEIMCTGCGKKLKRSKDGRIVRWIAVLPPDDAGAFGEGFLACSETCADSVEDRFVDDDDDDDRDSGPDGFGDTSVDQFWRVIRGG